MIHIILESTHNPVIADTTRLEDVIGLLVDHVDKNNISKTNIQKLMGDHQD